MYDFSVGKRKEYLSGDFMDVGINYIREPERRSKTFFVGTVLIQYGYLQSVVSRRVEIIGSCQTEMKRTILK